MYHLKAHETRNTMVTTGWAYDVICPIGIKFNLLEKYKMHTFNKAKIAMTVATELFCYSCYPLGQVEWYSSKIIAEFVRVYSLCKQIPSSSENKHILWIKSIIA